MKLRKRQFTKVALGIVLVICSALLAVFVRNALEAAKPENALPQLTVYYNGTENNLRLPAAHIYRDAFSWRFLFWQRQGGGKDLEVWREIIPVDLLASTPLALGFDMQPQAVKVAIAYDEGAFQDIGGQLSVPNMAGTYVYRVDANFGKDRDVCYYVRIKVPW